VWPDPLAGGTSGVAPGDRSLLCRVTALFRHYRVAVYGVGVLILLSSGLGVVSPLLIRVVFDRGCSLAADRTSASCWSCTGR